MSTLLKALEKAEDERKTGGDQQPSGAAPDPGKEKGGFKLSGSSKLSSALHSSAAQAEKAQAARVVSGYEAGQEHEEVEDSSVLIRQARTRKFVALAVVAVLAVGGYYAYNQFLAPQDAPADLAAAETEEAADAESAADSEVVYLPLVEPEYDLQQDIRQAVSVSGETTADLQANQNEELSRRITQFTQQLLAESIEEARRRRQEDLAARRRQLEEEAELRVTTVETLEERLANLVDDSSQDIDEKAVAFVAPNDYMLSQLEAIGEKPFVQRTRTRNEFIAPAGTQNTDLLAQSRLRIAQAEAAAAGEEGEESGESAPAPAPAPVAADNKTPSARITKNEDELEKVFDDAVASYDRGDFEASENGFRTVLASYPKHVNAMIGLAKVHSSRGNVRIALNTLLRASDLQPSNPLVISELVALQTDSGQQLLSEKRLSGMLGSTNDRSVEARLHFLLGSIYARQERWFEAREVFSYAHQAERGNPDYAYNLAVVHDFLNDSEEAIRMYRTAADLTKASVSAFDPQIAIARADELAGL